MPLHKGKSFHKGKKLRGGLMPIDKKITGTDGTKGMVGKRVKPIDRNPRDIFDPMS